MANTTEELITDVEMIDISDSLNKKDAATIQEIEGNILLIEKAVQTNEARFILRVLRSWSFIRRKLNSAVLCSFINDLYANSASDKDLLLSYVTTPTNIPETIKIRTGKNSTGSILPEIDGYIRLLVLVQLIDKKDYKKAVEFSDLLMVKLTDMNRRSLDLIIAKAYFYHMRCYELTDQLKHIRGFLYCCLRTATLHNNYEGKAVLINCLLRNYLHYNLYEQADKFIKKCEFPEQGSNNEWARFLYYQGRIQAVRLEYSDAQNSLTQALRKAPEDSAIGFKQTVQKLSVIVELLLGDIPKRQIFRQACLHKPLIPYFNITQSVRLGDVEMFNETLKNFGKNFFSDHTNLLILRLHHVVIKNVIRSIFASYSRISIGYIVEKLGLDSSEEAEFIIAKAIKDGIIEATIDSENGYVEGKEPADLFLTTEPQNAFHQRISFCLKLHNDSVKAMYYPPKSDVKKTESAEERHKRELEELKQAKKNADEDEHFFD